MGRDKSQEAKKALRLKRQIDLAAAQEAVERLQKQGKMDEMAETMKLVELLEAAESKDRQADDAVLAAIVKNSKAFTVRVLMEWGEGFNEEVHNKEKVSQVLELLAPKIELPAPLAVQVRCEFDSGKRGSKPMQLQNDLTWHENKVHVVAGEVITIDAYAMELKNADRRARTLDLYRAASEGDLESVRFVCAYAPERVVATDGQKGEYSQEMPLHWAAKGGHAEVALALIDANADTNAIDKFGQAPLHMAASKGHIETVKVLLAARADVEALDKDGDPPMKWAELNKHHKTCDVLFTALHKSKKAGMRFKSQVR